mgnify:CR=1 FL=1
MILSGVAFGGETGFLVGAMSMLTSNVLFGQGPWTPFQMFAMGLIGFLAGVSFQKGLLRAGRAPLAIFGAVSVVLVYSGIMNPAFIPAESEPFRSEGVLSDRFSLRSGPRGSDSAVSLLRRGADAGEARARQTQIWADRSRVKARFFVFSHKIYVHI